MNMQGFWVEPQFMPGSPMGNNILANFSMFSVPGVCMPPHPVSILLEQTGRSPGSTTFVAMSLMCNFLLPKEIR